VGNNSPATGDLFNSHQTKKSVSSFSQPSVYPAMQIKDDSFNPAEAQQLPGDFADIFLLRDFIVGQINTQQAAIDQVMK
jgi:hypothetical protein